MDPIDEAILFLLLTFSFSGLTEEDSDWTRARLIETSIMDSVRRQTQSGDIREGSFEENYTLFLERLNSRLNRLGVPGFFNVSRDESLRKTLSFDSPQFAERWTPSLIDAIYKQRRERSPGDLRAVAPDSQVRQPVSSQTAQSPVSRAAESRQYALAVSAAFSDPARFVTDPHVGSVSYETLKKLYERDTGV